MGSKRTALEAAVFSITRLYDKVLRIGVGDTVNDKINDKVNSGAAGENGQRLAIVVDGTLNSTPKPLEFLIEVADKMSAQTLLLLVLRNSYYDYFKTLFYSLLKSSPGGCEIHNFLTRRNLHLLAELSELEIVSFRPIPRFRFFSRIPFFRWGSVYTLALLRKKVTQRQVQMGVSVIIPVRNEAGNIHKLFAELSRLSRLPRLEAVFVEGGSSDATWETLQELARSYQSLFSIQILKQAGKGKADAVRQGLTSATGDLLMILDADLTVAPSELEHFYRLYETGKADLIIGTRLLFPFEAGAMRPLNFLGNLFFTKLVNVFLGLRLTDLLCGTKVISKEDYLKVCQWRELFKFYDPFGDFELVFAAAAMGFRIIELPVHYEARRYGATNISRFRDGFHLLQMTLKADSLKES